MNGAIALASAPVERSFSYLRVKGQPEKQNVSRASQLYLWDLDS